jgi:hypothetical protein
VVECVAPIPRPGKVKWPIVNHIEQTAHDSGCMLTVGRNSNIEFAYIAFAVVRPELFVESHRSHTLKEG